MRDDSRRGLGPEELGDSNRLPAAGQRNRAALQETRIDPKQKQTYDGYAITFVGAFDM